VRARVSDPLGPRWTRTVAPALAAMLIVLPPFALGSSAARATATLLGAALFFARRLVKIRHRARDAGVRVHPGAIEIVGAGVLNQRVRASDVLAASIARRAGRGLLALVRRGSTERPLVLDLASDADLEAVRRGLGLGRHGFGQVGWPTQGRSTALQGSTVLAIAWLCIAVSSVFNMTTMLGFALLLVVLPVTIVALLVACLQNPHAARVTLSAAGVQFTELPIWLPPIRYGDVVATSVEATGVVLTTSQGSVRVPMGRSLPEEREHLAAHVLSEAARARGEVAPEPALPKPLARLAPNGETEHAWLQRIDQAAAAITSANAYRGSDLHPRDLWTALEDPDTPVRVRAAAARVLARVAPEQARARVAQVLACAHDPRASACIRIALEDDVDAAARELQILEASGRG
jgi:hypothetical protein